MAELNFNTSAGSTVQRELMIAYLNTGTFATPVWSAIGKRVADSSMDIDWGEETTKDILGATYTTMKKPTITQSFEPGNLDGGDPAIVKLWNLAVKDHDYASLANMDLLIVHFYAGAAANPFAERYTACSIRPSSLGGEGGGVMGMPFDVTYGGMRIVGTAAKSGATVTFTPSATPDLPMVQDIVIDDVTWDVDFEPSTTSYEASADAASGAITVEKIHSDDAVVIVANGDSVGDGGTITWNAGGNLVTVTVTSGGVSNTYEIYVTYTA